MSPVLVKLKVGLALMMRLPFTLAMGTSVTAPNAMSTILPLDRVSGPLVSVLPLVSAKRPPLLIVKPLLRVPLPLMLPPLLTVTALLARLAPEARLSRPPLTAVVPV